MNARLLCGLVLVAGCDFVKDEDRAGTLPGGPGGVGTPGPGGDVDAGDPTGDGGLALVARVCLTRDLRTPSSGCSLTGAGDLLVTLGTRTAITNPDGTFTIAVPAGSSLTWRVVGTDTITSVMPFSADLVIPVISIDDYADLLTSNGAILVPQQGSAVVRVAANNVLLSGALVTTDPPATFATLYDGASAAVWDTDGTGVFGAAWVAGLPVGPAALTATPAGGGAQSVVTVIEDQAITFVTIEIP
jgi:hypothetical protein